MKLSMILAAAALVGAAAPAVADDVTYVPALKSPYHRLQAVGGYASMLVIDYSAGMKRGLSAEQAKEHAFTATAKYRREVVQYGEGYAAAVDATFDEVVNSATVTPR